MSDFLAVFRVRTMARCSELAPPGLSIAHMFDFGLGRMPNGIEAFSE